MLFWKQNDHRSETIVRYFRNVINASPIMTHFLMTTQLCNMGLETGVTKVEVVDADEI